MLQTLRTLERVLRANNLVPVSDDEDCEWWARHRATGRDRSIEWDNSTGEPFDEPSSAYSEDRGNQVPIHPAVYAVMRPAEWLRGVGEKVHRWIREVYFESLKSRISDEGQQHMALVKLGKMRDSINYLFSLRLMDMLEYEPGVKCVLPEYTGEGTPSETLETLFSYSYINIPAAGSYYIEPMLYSDARVVLVGVEGSLAYCLSEMFPSPGVSGLELRLGILADRDDATKHRGGLDEERNKGKKDALLIIQSKLLTKLTSDHTTGSWRALLQTFEELMRVLEPECSQSFNLVPIQFNVNGRDGGMGYDADYWQQILGICLDVKLEKDWNKGSNNSSSSDDSSDSDASDDSGYDEVCSDDDDYRDTSRAGLQCADEDVRDELSRTYPHIHDTSIWRNRFLFKIKYGDRIWVYHSPAQGANSTGPGSFIIARA